MFPVLATPATLDEPLQPIDHRIYYDKNGHSKTKVFLYKVAYTPLFSLPSNAQSLRLTRVFNCILIGASLLTALSMPPCSTYLNKLKPLISKIIPPKQALEWVKNVLKCDVGMPIAIVRFAVESICGLLIQKKWRMVLGTIIAVKAVKKLAALYLDKTKPTVEQHAAHLDRTATAAATKPPREFFETLTKINAVEETDKQPIADNQSVASKHFTLFMEKRITLIDHTIDTEAYVRKIQDILTYCAAQIKKDSKDWGNLSQWRNSVAAWIYEHTKNPVLALSVILKEPPSDYFVFVHAKIQLEECRSKATNRSLRVFEGMQLRQSTSNTVPKEIADLITQYIGHEFIETLFIYDSLAKSQIRKLNHRDWSGATFDRTTLSQFAKFLKEECFFENPEELRLAIDAETRPIDWSEKTLKARLEVLDDTVLDV